MYTFCAHMIIICCHININSIFIIYICINRYIYALADIHTCIHTHYVYIYTYIMCIYIGNLPIEEFLFFFCIPYSCVFTYHCLALFIKKTPSKLWETTITYTLIVVSLVLAAYYHEQKYTISTFLLMSCLLLFTSKVLKAEWLGKFYLIYPILIVPLLIVDGVLTGTGLNNPIVWYNPSEFIGLRIMTVPVEDIFYGLDLIFINLVIYQYLVNKNHIPFNNKAI